MSTVRRRSQPSNSTGSSHVTGRVGQPRWAGSQLLRARVSRRSIAGRAVLIWLISYAALRTSAAPSVAAAQATLVTPVWVGIGEWVTQTLRTMTFAIGSLGLALTTSVLGGGVISALAFWVPRLSFERKSLLIVMAATAGGAAVWTTIANRAVPPRRILIVGASGSTTRLLADLRRQPSVPLTAVAVVDDEESWPSELDSLRAGSIDDLPAVVRALFPDLVVVAVETGRPRVFAQLLEVADAGFEVVGLPEVYEFAFGRLPVEDLTSAWFMSVLHAYQRPRNHLSKRAFDVILGITGLILTLPLVPFIFVLVKRTPGPLLYRQRRLGEHGREFTILKFRSMRADAEIHGEARWASTNDARVIPGGRMLRRLRLDELPQLWNVLRGEMSMVGPRPERPEFVTLLQAEVPFWTQRHLLKPGITGWAQIRASYAADTLGTVEKLSYDLWYLRHRTILLDATICLKTIPRMILLRGSR